ALVIYEYATARAVGVDTFFHHPWLQTLSAYPGRMALTAAISFLSAGLALILISLRRSAIAAFAILHTVPLSLSMTSAIGYLVGITFVLPFNLGSQMAVHTAIALVAYGAVMLFYSWRQSERTAEGVPRWMPAIGILTVPLLFAGISISAEHATTLDRIVLLSI